MCNTCHLPFKKINLKKIPEKSRKDALLHV